MPYPLHRSGTSYLTHNTRREGRPLASDPCPSGRGSQGFRSNSCSAPPGCSARMLRPDAPPGCSALTLQSVHCWNGRHFYCLRPVLCILCSFLCTNREPSLRIVHKNQIILSGVLCPLLGDPPAPG